jgi:flagellar hook-associated protein 2
MVWGGVPAPFMAGLQLSGLVSGFDWKSLVDQLITAERIPADKLAAEKTANNSKNSALTNLQTRLTALQTSVTALGKDTLFNSRKATSATVNSSWKPAAATSTATGSYAVQVTRLATVSTRTGTSDVGSKLNSTNDVSGLTVASLPTATAVTAGTFSVNGKQVTVALTDSLAQVFTAISTATAGAVTASYDNTLDVVTLSGSSVVLGAANDTSNFLSAMKLANVDNATATSTGLLGVTNKSAVLTSARLKTAITAVDGSGNGTFSVNGVSINYNVNTDSLTAVLARINASGAGVTAAFDSSNDRVTLSNSITGDIGIGVSETAGGLMDALGLSSALTLARGVNAQYKINGGATLTSLSNTLGVDSHGITGLSLAVDTLDTQTIAVSGDTASMRTSIEDFIAKFNDVQSYIDTATKITTENGKVTAAVLASNREVQAWASSLRSRVFSAVPGLTGTISRLENLGIDFASTSSTLSIKDGTKLDIALRDKSSDVAAFFQTATTGLAKSMDSYLTILGTQSTDAQTRLTKSNTDLDAQIATIERRLTAQRSALEASFIAMESAQSRIKSQGDALTKAFGSSS